MRQSCAGRCVTWASSAVPIGGASTVITLPTELSEPNATPCLDASNDLETIACSAGTAAENSRLPKMIAYIIQPC